jgi:hypothetical protein
MSLTRKPSIQERGFLEFLINKSSTAIESSWQDGLLVESMNDGGMGSLLLFPKGIIKKNRLFGKCVSEYQFTDKDGVEVIASLNVDKNEELFELDVWKTDYSPLICFPEKL